MNEIKTWQERTVNSPPETLLISIETFRFMQAEIDELRAALAERDAALADAKRLEWLSQQGVSFGFQDIYEGNKWEIGGPYATLRIAIDAEMKGEQP